VTLSADSSAALADNDERVVDTRGAVRDNNARGGTESRRGTLPPSESVRVGRTTTAHDGWGRVMLGKEW
jgi:hypothetical protein